MCIRDRARDGLEREVNKELLKAIIKIAEETDTTGCTPSSVQALKEALASGRALLEDENAGQQQINEAVGAIHAALVNLVDQADKTALEALLEEASKLTEGKYTAASWEKLKNAKKAAQVVLENADATPQEVEEAYDALLDALVGLELIPVDKSNLKVAINLAKPIVAEADRCV